MTPTRTPHRRGLGRRAAGAVNALAGGGTLISFPALLALGVPPIAANVTNAVALSPGYFGATLAQLRNLRGQRTASLGLCSGGDRRRARGRRAAAQDA